jgi:surface antigen
MIFFEAKPPELSPLIQIILQENVTETTETPKEYTLEEKIATNYYKCDEATQYIRADNATCIARPTYRASESRSTTKSTKIPVTAQNTATAPSGWFPYGQCTYWVWSNRSVGQWNNASSWYSQAKRDGWATGSTPQVGAIAWEYGHVSLVEAVNSDGTVDISEMNYSGLGVVTYRTRPASQFKYIY